MTVVGWHHRLDGHELEQVLGDDDGKGSLACCSPWGHKESDVTERLNCWSPCPLLATVLSLSPQQHGSRALSAPSTGAEVLKLPPDGKPRLPASHESATLCLSSSP